jgi:HSP20 family protein
VLMRPFRYTSPWRELSRLQREMNRLFERTPTWPGLSVAPGYPAVNVWTQSDGAIVTAELPGVEPDCIDISVQDDTLTVRGTRECREAEEGVTYHRRERRSGSFARTIQLPFQVQGNGVEATFEKGVLHISLPRAEEDKPKRITVKAG